VLQVDNRSELELKLEHVVSSERTGYVVGFAGVYCKKLSTCVEVKTEIQVVADLIRQIQFYRKFLSGSWIVVSPDDWAKGDLGPEKSRTGRTSFCCCSIRLVHH
jgi:hypothetical protein